MVRTREARLRWLVFILMLLVCAGSLAGQERVRKPVLTAADERYLRSLDFLFDPRGAQRVVVGTAIRTVWTDWTWIETEAWLVPGKRGEPDRVFLADGLEVTDVEESDIVKVDFKAACNALYNTPPSEEDAAQIEEGQVYRHLGEETTGANDNELALAAWLYRLRERGLAAQALAAARSAGEEDPLEELRSTLAWEAYSRMVHAYMVRADEEALDYGEHLLRLYPGEADEQAGQIVSELKRRRRKGTFEEEPAAAWPTGFDTWDVKKKTSYLIDALEEVDARQDGQPGGVDLASDRRVGELIRLGDAAVPALLDVLEKDERLTRSVHFWRDFSNSRTVLSVREAALTAIMSILRVQAFEPASTGDNFTARGSAAASKTAKRLRAYWETYGRLPLDERMMKVLTSPETGFEAKREAAENLSKLNEASHLATTIQPTVIGAEPPRPPNPALKKFSNPTTAEAILAAMDADLKAHDAKPQEDAVLQPYERGMLEDSYLSALVRLGDQRIVAEMARRATSAQTSQARRKWAHAAHFLGDPKPFQSFAEDFRAGGIKLPAGEAGERELSGILGALVNVGGAEASRALDALADPGHPQHHAAVRKIVTLPSWSFDKGLWFDHPYCLRILRTALGDTALTGATYIVENGSLARRNEAGTASGRLPELLADPAARWEKAEERVCDAAAMKLGELVAGLPSYHPLLKDAEDRLAALRAAFDRYAGHYRLASRRESRLLAPDAQWQLFLPDIRPLGRAATAEDVKAGRAVFHLDGRGKPASLELPAVAVLNSGTRPAGVLIVQAEVLPSGEMRYGVIAREEVRAVAADELRDIRTMAEWEKDENGGG